tara:strand:+ start:185 stop:424 length:240 start_codon:yes stop_codon:yes gene_type:complete
MAVNLCFMAPITLLPGFKATENALGISAASSRAGLVTSSVLRLAILALVGTASLRAAHRQRAGHVGCLVAGHQRLPGCV